MKVQKITLREIRMPLVTPFETSFGRLTDRRMLIVEVFAGGISGWGESVAGEGPFYAPETVETAWLILRDFIWPMLKDREFASAADVWEMLAPIRGHNMAKGAIEAALWDAEAKQMGIPLWKFLGGVRTEIPCGVSIGIKETLDELVGTVERELSAGYQRIKIKIKPGKDVEPVERLRQTFPRIRLMVDANSAYRLEDWPHLKRLEAYYLMMIEQPLGWDDLYSHVELQRKLDTPICLDECIHTEEHARAAPAASSTSNLAAWVDTLQRAASIISASQGKSLYGAAGCWNPESAGRITSRSQRSRIFRYPAT
jgi:O-succinylbenzoate synthase